MRPRPSSLIKAPTKIMGNAAAVSDTRTPIRATSQPVPVVPIFAPNTRPNPCGKVSRPALTRPIVVMVVALDDCTSRVTTAPQNAPDSGVAAALLRTVRSPEPASALRPLVMTVMPSKKRPTPPRIEIATCARFPSRECNDDSPFYLAGRKAKAASGLRGATNEARHCGGAEDLGGPTSGAGTL
jgi:hypothetical protein